MSSKPPTVVSLFAGAGGLDTGFRQAGFEVVWANEINHDAAMTYRNNHGEHIVEADIKTISSSNIPDCDIVIGGPPCQGFSVAGKMNPDDPRSALLGQFVRVVRDKRPIAFVLENVKALATLDRWSDVRSSLIARFQELGYDVSYRVLDASQYGVPQLRERVFFVGTIRGGAVQIFPDPQQKTITVRESLKALPAYGQPGNNSFCRAVIVPAKSPILRPSPYAGMLFNGAGRPINLERSAPTLPASMGGNKTPIIDQHSLDTEEPNWIVGYHAHLRAGGVPYTSVPSRLRRLTVEECALIQSFPLGFRFSGKQSSRYCQIGNAVPPLLAFALAVQLQSCLFGNPRDNKSLLRTRRSTQPTLLDMLVPDPAPSVSRIAQ